MLKWYPCDLSRVAVLSSLKGFLEPELHLLGPDTGGSLPPNRVQCDGLYTVLAKVDGLDVGILYSDFRIFGGSIGKANADRALEFLDKLERDKIPCIFFCESLGVRFMEGRTVLKHAFRVVPRLASFAEKQLLITVSKGNTLGIMAFYFRQGHYRFAIKDKSQINLTGPEVIRLFFGQNFEFTKLASPENQLQTRRMVQEMLPDLACTRERIRNLLLVHGRKPIPASFYKPRDDERMKSHIKAVPNSPRLEGILQNLGPHFEVFEELDPVIRSFLVYRNGSYFGLLANNLGNSNNMVGPHGFAKYSESLKQNELTPTLKIKRQVVCRNFAEEIEKLYEDASVAEAS